jgi:uncharacterized protein YjiS (DUF1127 family)
MSVVSLSKTVTYSRWSRLEELFGEWWHRTVSRYELESLSERDLADIGDDSYRCLQRDPEAFLASVTATGFWDCRALTHASHVVSCSSRAFASLRSRVSNPSVNHP